MMILFLLYSKLIVYWYPRWWRVFPWQQHLSSHWSNYWTRLRTWSSVTTYNKRLICILLIIKIHHGSFWTNLTFHFLYLYVGRIVASMYSDSTLLTPFFAIKSINLFLFSTQCYRLASEGNLGEAYALAKRAMHSAGTILCFLITIMPQMLSSSIYRDCLLWSLHSGASLLPRWSKVSKFHGSIIIIIMFLTDTLAHLIVVCLQ